MWSSALLIEAPGPARGGGENRTSLQRHTRTSARRRAIQVTGEKPSVIRKPKWLTKRRILRTHGLSALECDKAGQGGEKKHSTRRDGDNGGV